MLEVLTVAGSIDSRSGRGGTATVRVREQLNELLGSVDALTAWLSEPVGPGATGTSAWRPATTWNPVGAARAGQ